MASRLTGDPLEISSKNMVGFQDYMSVALDKCGSDRQTFGELVEVWNREEDEIRGMNRSELRDALTCP